MDVPYFVKEYPWMSAFAEATLKNVLVEVNPPQSCPWKQNGTIVVAAVMILEIVNNWRSVLQITRLWTLITFCYRKCMLLLQYLRDRCLHTVHVWQKFWRKNIANWMIIWIKFKVLWLLWVLYSALASTLDGSCKGNWLTRVDCVLQA